MASKMKKGQRRPSPALSLLAPGQERALCCMQSSRVDDQAVWTLLLELQEGLSKTTGRIRGRASQIQVSPTQLGPPETVFEAHGRPCPCRCDKDASSSTHRVYDCVHHDPHACKSRPRSNPEPRYPPPLEAAAYHSDFLSDHCLRSFLKRRGKTSTPNGSTCVAGTTKNWRSPGST